MGHPPRRWQTAVIAHPARLWISLHPSRRLAAGAFAGSATLRRSWVACYRRCCSPMSSPQTLARSSFRCAVRSPWRRCGLVRPPRRRQGNNADRGGGGTSALLGSVALGVVATAVADDYPLALAIGERPIRYASGQRDLCPHRYYLAWGRRRAMAPACSSIAATRWGVVPPDRCAVPVPVTSGAGGWLRYDHATRTLTAQRGDVLLTYPAGGPFEGPEPEGQFRTGARCGSQMVWAGFTSRTGNGPSSFPLTTFALPRPQPSPASAADLNSINLSGSSACLLLGSCFDTGSASPLPATVAGKGESQRRRHAGRLMRNRLSNTQRAGARRTLPSHYAYAARMLPVQPLADGTEQGGVRGRALHHARSCCGLRRGQVR